VSSPGHAGLRRWSRPELLRLAARLVRFGIVGGLATVTHAGVSVAALRWLGFAPVFANIAGFCVAVVVSFCGHSLFTFRAQMSVPRAVRFVTVALSSVAVSSGLVLAADAWTTLRPDVYLPLVALCTPVFNFAAHSLWTFRRTRGIVD
jgi:putative flippase GtrA